MVLLLWCVCGGLLLHMLESNYLGILVKPSYEKPMDTALDVLDRGVTILWYPYYDWYKEMQLTQNESKVLRDLAENVYVARVRKIFLIKD